MTAPTAVNDDLTERLKAEGLRLGFDKVGVAPAVTAPDYPRFLDWLEAGCAAGMGYLERHADARGDPNRILQDVRSIVMVSMVYGRPDDREPGPTEGKIARYARGLDYHDVLRRRLEDLHAWLVRERPEARGRVVVDTAPLLERDYARLAGLGWVGKNTMLIDRKLGSFTFLGALATDVELRPDAAHEPNHCGTCTRCLDACPTDAFDGPYRLDARRCISYWTIEHRGPIDETYRDRLDGWVFGCDVCQDVCPWNRKAAIGREESFTPRDDLTHPNLIEWLTSEGPEFAKTLRSTSLQRAKRSGLMRNAALILGARRVAEAAPALEALLTDQDPVIRDATEWALRRIRTVDAIVSTSVTAPSSPAGGDGTGRAAGEGRPLVAGGVGLDLF